MVGLIALATVATTASGPNTMGSANFIENLGQWNSRAKFLLKQPGVNYWVTNSGTVIDFHQERINRFEDENDVARVTRDRVGDVVSVDFVGASATVKPVGVSRRPGASNFISPEGQFNGVGSFAETRLVNVVPGVTARYYVDAGSPRYDVILAPGTSPSSVQLKYTNAKNLRVAADGSLAYDVRFGTVREQKLFVYQTVDGVKQPIDAKFTVKGSSVGFQLGQYDESKPLVIDPQIFINGTYLGGASGTDQIGAMDKTPDGNFVVAGRTASTNFPTTVGAYQTDQAGNDWFISEVNSNLTGLGTFSTYVGGAGNEQGVTTTENLGVHVLDNNEVIFAGTGSSTGLPTGGKSGTIQNATQGSDEGYILRLKEDGTFRYATYFGGTGGDDLWDIDVDPNGNIAVSLGTASTNLGTDVAGVRDRLVVGSAADATKGAGTGFDAFVAIVDKDFDDVIMGTYFGGNDTDQGRAVAFGRNYSSVVLAGTSESTDMTWGVGSVQNTGGSDRDNFVARFSRKTGGVLGSAAFGYSTDDDTIEDVQVDQANDRPYATGRMQGGVDTPGWATAAFPVKYGYDSTFNGTVGTQNAFISKFSSEIDQVVFTYFEGTGGNTSAKGLALQSSGSVHIVGYTRDPNFIMAATAGGTNITAIAPQNSGNGQQGFHARFSDGLGLNAASLIGDTDATAPATDTANVVILYGPWNNVAIAGQATSPTLQVGAGAFQTTLVGANESGFIQLIATTTKPIRLNLSYLTGLKSQTNNAQVVLNAPVVNPAGQSVTFTITGPARFLNGTQTTTAVVPAGSSSVSVKVFPNASISATSLVTVSASAQAVTVNNSFSVSP